MGSKINKINNTKEYNNIDENENKNEYENDNEYEYNNDNENDDDYIDITGIDKLKLFYFLWHFQNDSIFLRSRGISIPFDIEKAKIEIKKGYIDYFCGRCIKINFLKDKIYTVDYDRSTFNYKVKDIVNFIKLDLFRLEKCPWEI